MMRGILFLACLVPSLAGMAWGDVVPPDSKPIKHRVRFENLREHPGFVFYVYPRDLPRSQPGNSSVRFADETELSALNPMAVSMAGGAYLYAVPESLHAGREAPDETWFKPGGTTGVRYARLVDPRKYASTSAPYDTIVTRYRIEGLPGALRLDLQGEETLAGGVPVSPLRGFRILLALSVLALGWIALRMITRKPRPVGAR